MDDDLLRNLAADSMAQGFIVELLLTDHLGKFGPYKEALAKDICATGRRTDHFAGIAKDDATAEVFADVVVRMHDALDGYVARALARTGERASAARKPPA